MRRLSAVLLSLTMAFSMPVMAENKIPAFPGAEGGGKYTTGGRGGEVYVVTTLEDYDPDTQEPIKGSLRDALSQDNRIVVFNVGGVIRLKDKLAVTKKNNLSVLGQTAPGNGITVYGYETNLSNSNNIIMRYLRFRPGADNVLEGDSMDSIWGRAMKDLMIDHLSCSWSTDETMSLYRAENMTVQWSVIAESLTMSGHTKGRHGYGAICGGVNTTYHHNLYASHTSRNPRFGGGTVEADDNEHIACFDFRNNVIYNWGYNTGYGGGRAESNYVYNYMKPGPGTRDSVKSRVFDCGEKNKPGYFYINGNVIEGNEEVTDDNGKGIYISDENRPFTTIVDKEFEMDALKDLHTDTPEAAYDLVLKRAGATLPLRDALDARIIQSVRDNTGYFANRHEEVGGLPYTEETMREADFDKDMDGIADWWELENGLSPSDPTDSGKIAANGYAYVENYANSLVDMAYEPENSDISIVEPLNNQQFNVGETVKVRVDADDNVERVVLYNNDNIVDEDNTAPFEFEIKNLADGTYNISVKAYNIRGEQTQSMAHKIHINTKPITDMEGWTSIDIGNPPVKGSASMADGVIRIKGSGKLEKDNDSCHYVYKKVKGDFDLVTKVESTTPVDNHAFSGIMVRTSEKPDSAVIGIGISNTKAYEWKETNTETGKSTTYYRNPYGVYLFGRNGDGKPIDLLAENLDSVENAQKSGVQLKKDIPFKDGLEFKGYYLRLVRKGDRFNAYGSSDGSSWQLIGSKYIELSDELLVGIGADGNKVNNDIDNLNTAEFSHIVLK